MRGYLYLGILHLTVISGMLESGTLFKGQLIVLCGKLLQVNLHNVSVEKT